MLSPWERVTASIKSFVNPIKLPPLIITAGGKSSRMGYPKGLLEYKGRHLVMSLLDIYRRSGGKRAVIVLGYEIEKYFAELPFLATLTPPCDLYLGSLRLSIAINKTPEKGQFSSIQTGIDFLKNELDDFGVFYHSVDRPPTDIKTWHNIAFKALDINHQALFYENDTVKAQPVWLSQKTALQILKEDPQTTRLDGIVKAIGKALKLETSFYGSNINTLEDWANVKTLLPDPSPLTFEIKGKKRSGKTTYIKKLIMELSEQGFKVGGILQPALDGNFDSSGYDIENVTTKERVPLARRRLSPAENGLWFDFYDDAFAYAKDVILNARKTCDVLVVDEIGKLEAKGLGHQIALNEEIKSESCFMKIYGIRELSL